MAELLKDKETIEANHVALLGAVTLCRTWYDHTRNEDEASFGERMRDLRRMKEAEERLAAFEKLYELSLPEADPAA